MCTECVFAYGTLLYNRQYIERISRGEGGGVMTCDLWRICHRLVGTPSNVFLLCWLVSLGAYNQRNILRIVKMVCTIFNTSYYFLKSVKYCTPTRVLITKWQPHAQLDEVTLQWFTVVYKYDIADVYHTAFVIIPGTCILSFCKNSWRVICKAQWMRVLSHVVFQCHPLNVAQTAKE